MRFPKRPLRNQPPPAIQIDQETEHLPKSTRFPKRQSTNLGPAITSDRETKLLRPEWKRFPKRPSGSTGPGREIFPQTETQRRPLVQLHSLLLHRRAACNWLK